MSPVETVMQSNRKKIIIGAGIVAGGLWILLVMYLLAESKKDYSIAQPGIVAVHAPSPLAGGSSPSATFRSSRLFAPQAQYSVPTYQWSYIQQTPMSSTSMHLYQTSNATVQSVGGGGGNGIFTTSGGNNGGRGVRSSSISYGGSLLALSSSVALASPGAREATSLASTTEESASQNRPGRIKTTNGDPDDPFLDPIGDIAWPLMLLLTIGWCVRLRLRKQQ